MHPSIRSAAVVYVCKQIGLGISETEDIGDEPGEMGEELQAANLGGVGSKMN